MLKREVSQDSSASQLSHDSNVCKDTQCEICRLKRHFTLPGQIVDAAVNQKLVIFAGAGVSTEAREVFKTSLYQEVRNELRIAADEKITFPKLMSRYTSPPRSRGDLLRKIKDRFDQMKMFPEIRRFATRFHRELSTIPHIQEIITTNWDDLFEQECDATPIVTPDDFAAFSDLPGRKVFKIHGSINNIGSIIATQEDYEACYRKLRTGLIGAKLRVILATKTVVFAGYSFQDEDLRRLYRLLGAEIGQILPHSYIVTPDENAKDALTSLGMKLTPIVTDATFLAETLKQQLIKRKMMLPDQRFDEIETALDRLTLAHFRLTKRINYQSNPEVIFCIAYQVGVRHAFEDISETKKSGRFSDPNYVRAMIHSYDKTAQRLRQARRYHDLAYVEGFLNGIAYLLADDTTRRELPLYLLFGHEGIKTLKEYRELSKRAEKLHKSAYVYAKRVVQRQGLKKGDIVFGHTPFL
jgi:hypothetical protein